MEFLLSLLYNKQHEVRKSVRALCSGELLELGKNGNED